MRVVVLGNSGSGKSTLAARLARASGAAHIDLDTVAWASLEGAPQRRPLADSLADLADALAAPAWIVEGCYGDLAAAILPRATRLVFLDPGVDACLANARARPWEPHKYATREAQDANLAMLLDWIAGYATRDGHLSRAAHAALFDAYAGDKVRLETREAIAAYLA